MDIIKDISKVNIDKKAAVALGKFDGIHLGHLEIINKILEKKSLGYIAMVFTFDISAAGFFKGSPVKEVTTIKEKECIFESMGVDVLVEFPLNKETAATDPVGFITDILVDSLNMKYIVAGDDISFGYKGQGNKELLYKYAPVCGYEVDIIDKLTLEGRDISSTYVREEISKGNMNMVTKLLGHPYSFAGTVKQGFKLGHKLGMPTLNLYPDPEKILPPLGVYYSKVYHKGAMYPGITNIGMRPTVSETDRISVETYLYDFDKDMYGEDIVTELLEFKRPEMKFSSVEDLKAQMNLDILEGKKYV